MNNDEYKKTIELLKFINRIDLYSDFMLKRGYNYVEKVINMPEWKDPKFEGLLTSNIWKSNYNDIQSILKMPEWKDPKFEGLLTSNIWNSSYNESILKMPEWKDPKFEGLLTPTIWNSSYKQINTKLYLPYWKEQKYHHLLVPSIFSVSISNIEKGIELFKKYEIDGYITNKCLRHKISNLENLINYLVENNLPLLETTEEGKYKLNPVLSCEKGQLKKKYGIDIDNLNTKGGKSL